MFKASYITNIGKTSANQEDSILFDHKVIQSNMKIAISKDFNTGEALFALSDGIAGLKYGEIASRKVLEYLEELVQDKFHNNSLMQCIKETQSKLVGLALNHAKYYGIGATLAGIYFYGNEAHIFNVGDSRVYLFRDNILSLLSIDHTLARKIIERGELPNEQSRAECYNQLESAIIASVDEDDFEIHTQIITMKPDDKFIICSDGITDMIDDSLIENILQKSLKIEESVQNIFEQVLLKGEDNLSLIVIYC